MTPQRRAIVECLERSPHHPTADEVFSAVNRRFPMTSRATVYNTLNLLTGAGLLREIRKDGNVRYDPNLGPHHHFVCRGCGAIEDVAWEALPPLALDELPGRGRADSYEVTLFGLCGRCRKSR
jgi:Fe2+ or Zn2+ uptake regulation protein